MIEWKVMPIIFIITRFLSCSCIGRSEWLLLILDVSFVCCIVLPSTIKLINATFRNTSFLLQSFILIPFRDVFV